MDRYHSPQIATIECSAFIRLKIDSNTFDDWETNTMDLTDQAFKEAKKFQHQTIHPQLKANRQTAQKR